MVKVIETNISLDQNDNFVDFQSRVIEVESWESFIDEIKNGTTVSRTAIFGNLTGASYPRHSKIEELEYDHSHLRCNFTNVMDMKFKKLAYLINE